MDFSAGQCFLYPILENETPHVWVIVTKPNQDDQFAIVNFTTLKGSKDQTVILRKGEHPFIVHDTCVNYNAADITEKARLNGYLSCGEARMERALNGDLLKLVQDGFSASPFAKKRLVDFVRSHK